MCLKLWFISKAAFNKATLTLDSCGTCKSWFVRITRLNSVNAILMSCAANA